VDTAIVLLVLLAVLAANLPWFSERLFYLIPLRSGKHLGWCILELAVLYFVIGGIARLVEYKALGQVTPQHWEFYVITACLFIVLAFPGFVYRYFWRR
jgi:hypothetical protein